VDRLRRWSQHSLLPSSLLLLDVPGGPVVVWGGSDAAREHRHQRDALKCAKLFGESLSTAALKQKEEGL
jgi:hypothetical protein